MQLNRLQRYQTKSYKQLRADKIYLSSVIHIHNFKTHDDFAEGKCF